MTGIGNIVNVVKTNKVRKFIGNIPSSANRQMKTTPAFVKKATNSEQTALNNFQNSIINKGSIYFNRVTRRLFNK